MLGEVARLIPLPLARCIPPRWPAHDQWHQPRLLPTSVAPSWVRGGSAPGKGGASLERQHLNNSRELSERNKSRCSPGRRGALGRAQEPLSILPFVPSVTLSRCFKDPSPSASRAGCWWHSHGFKGTRSPRAPQHHHPALLRWGRGVPSTHVTSTGRHMPGPSSSWDRGWHLPP